MAVKIRLMRIGAKKRPFYRVVAVDERRKRTGQYLENLGTYNPLTEPKEIILKKDRIEYWVKNGAILSTGYLRIIGEAPQRPPRKPKKEKKEEKHTETPTKEKPAEDSAGQETAPAEEGSTQESAPAPVESKPAEEAAGTVETQDTPENTKEQEAREPETESAQESTDEETKA